MEPPRDATWPASGSFRQDERDRKAALDGWLAEVHEAFDFLCRDRGASVGEESMAADPYAAPRRRVTYVLPALSLQLSQDGHATAALLRVPLPEEGGEAYEFDPAELIWHVYTRASERRGWGSPPFRLNNRHSLGTPAGIASLLVPRCDPELCGDTAAFREIVALRRAGATPNPRVPRWRRFTTCWPISALDHEVNLPSPDGRYVASFHGSEMGMSGPMRGRVHLSTGHDFSDCSAPMVWSADSAHLAFLRVDTERRQVRLAVVDPLEGIAREARAEPVGFVRLQSFQDGVVTLEDGTAVDVRSLGT